ncbi:MPN499 family protein [Mycoplasmopsis cricetuli]|uniref:MPN499 family protein n=1 Tax=Mycoplasmopsis cricetuli TaxID=171283 RepID=UPI00056703B1|nr:hypothetical protein [Mycoplasmopsis cricetuli]
MKYKKTIKTIKINQTSNGYWLIPKMLNIFSYKISNFVIKHTATLDDMIEKNNFTDQEIIFSFNGDHHFKKFNELMKKRKIQFYLDEFKIVKMSKNDTFEFELNENIKIVWDYQGILAIYQGKIPFFSLNWYQEFYLENLKHNPTIKQILIYWTKKGYQIK